MVIADLTFGCGQSHPVASVAARAKGIYAAWLPKVMLAQASSAKPAKTPTSVKGNGHKDPGSAPADTTAARTNLPHGAPAPVPKNTELRMVGAAEQFEALAGDGAWYDAKVLELMEERSEHLPPTYRVRVEFQNFNCNQVITEDRPFKHIRRRSEAFRVGQLPQVGTTVLAFQQRKSYDLYYDADVIRLKLDPGSEPQVLVQYLHGPEERKEEWLPLQALHRIQQTAVTVGQMKTNFPCSVIPMLTDKQIPKMKQLPRQDLRALSGKSIASPAGSGLAGVKGPPYCCCVCGKAFNHPPAHSSHEKAHLQQLSSSERARILQLKEANKRPPIAAGVAHAHARSTDGREEDEADAPASVVPESDASQKLIERQVSVDQKDSDVHQPEPGAAPAKECFQMSSVDEEKLDMKEILRTWKTADEEHIKVFKRKLRHKHPEVSQDAKMCSDTQLLIDGSGIIRHRVDIDSAGQPTLRACTEKERAMTIKILSRQADTRKLAFAELDWARKVYTRFHLPLTLEAVRDLGQDLRSDHRCRDADKRVGSYTFSTLGGRCWVPILDPLLEASLLPTQKKLAALGQGGGMGHGGARRAHVLTDRCNGISRVPPDAKSKDVHNLTEDKMISRLKTAAGCVVTSRDLKLDGLPVYVNGTGVHHKHQARGILVKGARDKILRVKHEGRVKSLSDFCDAAGNTMRRVQQNVMVTGTDPPLCLAEYIAQKADSISVKGVAGSDGRPRVFSLPPVEKRIRGRRVQPDVCIPGHSEQGEGKLLDGQHSDTFKASGSLYIGHKISLPLDRLKKTAGTLEEKVPVELAVLEQACGAVNGSAENDAAGVGRISAVEDAVNVVKEVCTKEYLLQSQRAAEADAAAMEAVTTNAASVAASTAIATTLLLQHLQQVEQQAMIQVKDFLFNQTTSKDSPVSSPTTHLRGADAGTSLDSRRNASAPPNQAERGLSTEASTLKIVSKQWIVDKMRSISGLLAPQYLWLAKDARILESCPSSKAEHPKVPATAATIVEEDLGNSSKMSIGADITHYMAPNSDVYTSATWGGAAALWQCTRDDGVIEHLEEDEVRAGLAAAGMRVEDMPELEDRLHGAWARQPLIKGESARASSGFTGPDKQERIAERPWSSTKMPKVDGGCGHALEERWDSRLSKVYVKHKKMRPAALLAVRIISRLKSTAFAHNGMLSSRQGRQRWKTMACDRDLSKFGKLIKTLEANLVWSAVTPDFDALRHELLESAENLSSVMDAVKALQLLDSCILDSFRRKTTQRVDSQDGKDEDDDAGAAAADTGVSLMAGGAVTKGGSPLRNGSMISLPGEKSKKKLLIGRAKPFRDKVRLNGAKLAGRSALEGGTEHDDDHRANSRGSEIVDQVIRVRTRCDVTGKFRWMRAKVKAFEERDTVRFHCLEILDATAPAQEPLWICLQRGNHSLGESSKRKAAQMLGGGHVGVDESSDEVEIVGMEVEPKRRRHGLADESEILGAVGQSNGGNHMWENSTVELVEKVGSRGQRSTVVRNAKVRGLPLGGRASQLGARNASASAQVLAAKRFLNASRNRLQGGRGGRGGSAVLKRGMAGAAARWWGKAGKKSLVQVHGYRGNKAQDTFGGHSKRREMTDGGIVEPQRQLEALAQGDASCAQAGSGAKALVENASCCGCGLADREEKMLLCDFCDAGWHMDCLPSPLQLIPDGEWKCPNCEAGKARGRGRPKWGSPAAGVVGVPTVGRPKQSTKVIPLKRAGGRDDIQDRSCSAKRPVHEVDAETRMIMRQHDSLTNAATALGVGKSTMANLIQNQRPKDGCLYQYVDGGGVRSAAKRDWIAGRRLHSSTSSEKVERAPGLSRHGLSRHGQEEHVTKPCRTTKEDLVKAGIASAGESAGAPNSSGRREGGEKDSACKAGVSEEAGQESAAAEQAAEQNIDNREGAKGGEFSKGKKKEGMRIKNTGREGAAKASRDKAQLRGEKERMVGRDGDVASAGVKKGRGGGDVGTVEDYRGSGVDKAAASSYRKTSGKREREGVSRAADTSPAKDKESRSQSAGSSSVAKPASPESPAAASGSGGGGVGDSGIVKRSRGRPRKDGTPTGSPRVPAHMPVPAASTSPLAAGKVGQEKVGSSGKEDEDVKCQVCSSGKRARDLLLCDACDAGWHIGLHRSASFALAHCTLVGGRGLCVFKTLGLVSPLYAS